MKKTKNKEEAKAMTEHISCDFKFNGTTCNSNVNVGQIL